MAFKFNPFTGNFDKVRGSKNQICLGSGSTKACLAFDGVDTVTLTINDAVVQTWQNQAAQPLQGNPMGLLLSLTYASDQ